MKSGGGSDLDPLQLARLSDAYVLAGQNLASIGPHVRVFLMAFAVELCLKALYLATEKQRWPRPTHDLLELYVNLRPKLQEQIAAGWVQERRRQVPDTKRLHLLLEQGVPLVDAQRRVMFPSFLEEIEKGRNQFEQCRYAFEETLEVGDIFDALPAIRQSIEEEAARTKRGETAQWQEPSKVDSVRTS